MSVKQLKDESDGSDVEDATGCPIPIVGDVIGDTAYSERYVLKVLMKFANLEVFKRVVKQEAFDSELVTVWEMSAEKDVVYFLLEHDALDLFSFALPELELDQMRIAELVVGIIANMCCVRESVSALIKNRNLLSLTMGYLKTDYTAALVQSLRVISHCLYLADEDRRRFWMSTFEDFKYAETLCFIMKNSSNKDLLIAALENFNTLCEHLNIDSLRKEFFKQFVIPEVLESVSTAFNEIMTKQKSFSEIDSLERILAIALQIGLNLVWFDNSPPMFTENRWGVVTMLSQVLGYYEHKIVNNKVIDSDLEHIFQSATMILNTLNVSEISDPKQFFFPAYRIWKALTSKQDKYGNPLITTGETKMVDQSIHRLSEFLCVYLAQCTDENFVSVMSVIKHNYKPIMKESKKCELQEFINHRVNENALIKKPQPSQQSNLYC